MPNALRDMIYNNPVGTETLTGMQTASPIDQYPYYHQAMDTVLPFALGFGGTAEFESLKDYIALLNKLKIREPTYNIPSQSYIGFADVLPRDLRATSWDEIEPYKLGPQAARLSDHLRSINVRDPSTMIYPEHPAEHLYDPIEQAVDKIMSRLYGGWETEK